MIYTVLEYENDGNVSILDNAIYYSIEEVKERIRKEMDKQKRKEGKSNRTYVVINGDFMCLVCDEEMQKAIVKRQSIVFEDGERGIEYTIDSDCASFAYAHANVHNLEVVDEYTKRGKKIVVTSNVEKESC